MLILPFLLACLLFVRLTLLREATTEQFGELRSISISIPREVARSVTSSRLAITHRAEQPCGFLKLCTKHKFKTARRPGSDRTGVDHVRYLAEASAYGWRVPG